jgi:hypothetical protein
MSQRHLFREIPRRWNSGRTIGAKPPFKAKHVWEIRQQLKAAKRVKKLALFDCANDSKLRRCDLVKLRISDAHSAKNRAPRAVRNRRPNPRGAFGIDQYSRTPRRRLIYARPAMSASGGLC